MPNLPVRGLGMVGVITDISPTDLPASAWSNARNVRFDGDAVTRASVFKPFLLPQDFAASPPVLVLDDTLRSNTKSITTLRQNGTLTRIADGLISDVSPTTPFGASLGNMTAATVGEVMYVNNQVNVPISYANGEARYSQLPTTAGTGWPTATRCKALRSYKDYLVALNLTDANLEYPNKIMWSDAVQVGQRPNWDIAGDSSQAGDNVLNVSTGRIVDGAELGDQFIIYGTKEVFLMSFIGGSFIFAFRKLFNNFSIMTQNCVVEVNSRHYVFCEDDIMVTDGSSYESICNGKIKRKLFGRIDYSKRDNCRVFHNSLHSEIIFAYPSSASDCAWTMNDIGCNEAAVFNYVNNTWAFIDLPNVSSATESTHPIGAIELGKTWATSIGTWADQNNTWAFTTASPSTLIMAQTGNSAEGSKLVFYDDDTTGRIGNEADPATYWGAWAEMVLYDFDDLGIPITDSKLIRSLSPQIITENSTKPVGFQIKSDKLVTDSTPWPEVRMFNPHEQFRLDYRVSGRYISLRYSIPQNTDARFNGFDLMIEKSFGR